MSFQYVGVEDCPIQLETPNPEPDDDNYRPVINGYAIVLGFDDGYVIEAENKTQLVEFARTLLRMTEDFLAMDES